MILFKKLKNELRDRFFFIIGETSYGICCADDIAALHLKGDLIIRVGNSCLTKNKQLPVYFLIENQNLIEDEIIKSLNDSKIEYGDKNILVFYNQKFYKAFEKLIKNKNSLDKNISISQILYKPDQEILEKSADNKNFEIYNRIFINVSEIKKDDVIIYFGDEQDKILFELSTLYVNNNQIFSIDSEYKIKEITTLSANRIFYKRFNLIEKAKESEVFGILVGSLSIDGLNEIIEEVKLTLKSQKKHFYTFLLGKITLEKLSNFVEYIDCFILIACPFNAFYEFKTLMRPLVSALDIKIAFDPNYSWDMKYTFDARYILGKKSQLQCSEETSSQPVDDTIPTQKLEGLILLESEKNQALAQVFSVKVLQTFDQKKYKGLDIKETEGEVKKFRMGRTGLPIKYEDINK